MTRTEQRCDGDVTGFSFQSDVDPTESLFVQLNTEESEHLDFETSSSMPGNRPESLEKNLVVPADATYLFQVMFDKRQRWSAVAEEIEDPNRPDQIRSHHFHPACE